MLTAKYHSTNPADYRDCPKCGVQTHVGTKGEVTCEICGPIKDVISPANAKPVPPPHPKGLNNAVHYVPGFPGAWFIQRAPEPPRPAAVAEAVKVESQKPAEPVGKKK